LYLYSNQVNGRIKKRPTLQTGLFHSLFASFAYIILCG
jgi:hypothetical protein